MAHDDDELYCKLRNKKIELGLCLDINYEIVKVFNTNTLQELELTDNYADAVCESCPYCPIIKVAPGRGGTKR